MEDGVFVKVKGSIIKNNYIVRPRSTCGPLVVCQVGPPNIPAIPGAVPIIVISIGPIRVRGRRTPVHSLLRLRHRAGQKETNPGQGQQHPRESATAVPRFVHGDDFIVGIKVDFVLHNGASFEG